MIERPHATADESRDNVETLLGQARPRPAPPEIVSREIRDTVRDEWRQVVKRGKRRRQWRSLAAAASVVLAVLLGFALLRPAEPVLVPVAGVERHYGKVYLVNEGGLITDGVDSTELLAGQTLVTDEESGAALAWHGGGSVRLGADTRVRLDAANVVYLVSGRVYYDSRGASGDALTIRTDFGDVSHTGTQYLAELDERLLRVSVREGVVAVDGGRRSSSIVGAGEQLAVTMDGSATRASLESWDGRWAWVERTAPPPDLDGRPIQELLEWVSSETGLTVRYEDESARAIAGRVQLIGTVEAAPRDALAAWMQTTDLDWHIENGVIYVSQAR